MIYKEVQQDLFTVSDGYYFAHCISADFALGAGIAKEFDNRYEIRHKLFEKYSMPGTVQSQYIGCALLIGNVFNLVTKAHYFQKPTYDTLYECIVDMKEQCIELGIDKIAMPKIGCGLDKLEWGKVRDIIFTVFNHSGIEILVCEIRKNDKKSVD